MSEYFTKEENNENIDDPLLSRLWGEWFELLHLVMELGCGRIGCENTELWWNRVWKYESGNGYVLDKDNLHSWTT